MADISPRELRIGGALLVSGQVVQAIVAFGANLVLVRYLMPEEFGRFAIILASASIGYSLLSFQIDALVIRASESRFHDQAKDRYFTALTLETMVAWLVLVVWLVISGNADQWTIGLVTALGIRHWVDHNRAFIERTMPYRRLALLETTATVAGHCVAVVLAISGVGWTVLIVREVFLALASLLLSILMKTVTYRRIRWITMSELWALVIEARGFWLDGVLENSFQRLTILLVGGLGGERSAGLFFQAQRLALVPHQFMAPIVSRIATNWFGRTEDSEKRRNGRNRLVGLTAVPLLLGAIATYLFADPIVPWLFGPSWQRSADLFSAMAGVVAFLSLFELLRSYAFVIGAMGRLIVGRFAQYLGLLLFAGFAAAGLISADIGLAYGLSAAYASAFIVVAILVWRRS